jgi:hypothetical protein
MMKLIVPFRNFENAPKNMKKCKLKLKYNYSTISDFSSKMTSSTYLPHAGFIGTNTSHILFLGKEKT